MKSSDQIQPRYAIGEEIFDYRVVRVEDLPQIDAVFYELEHGPTGARHIHIARADTENAFSVAFKTVPSDSTGVAHILEHTALCGSKKFPVRDPFFSMLKRSLSTFMNAFTASDWTMYPFTTQNRKDFYNLLDVYLDAAFYPRLDRLSFKQEGIRIEAEPKGEEEDFDLVYKGVVYNEMKGAMSSPDQVMGRSLLKALYPHTTYGNNSGGSPEEIPTLTHEKLLTFHRHHYHPSNAFFYTYGDIPLKDHLQFIGEKILKHFDRIDPGTDVPPQPRFSEPRTVTEHYPLDKSEDPAKKSQASVAWLLADIQEGFTVLSLILLSEILLGNPASPLRKALMDSELGSSLADATGYDSDNRDTMFSAGLKNVDPKDAEAIEKLVLDTLKGLAHEGIDPRLIESAIHQIEFHRKEVTNSPYPYGLKLFLFLAGTWFHRGNPIEVLNIDENLNRIREEMVKGGFFEGLIRKYFLENSHRVLFKLLPDQEMARKEEVRAVQELERIKSGLSRAEIETIQEDAKILARMQESEEDLSVLPTLELSDISPKIPTVEETAFHEELGATVYEQPTSGIFYFTAAAGAGTLSAELLPLVPFFCYALTKIGTRGRNWAEIAQEIDQYTGGLGLSGHSRTDFTESGLCIPFVTLSGKALIRNEARMFDLIREILQERDFTDIARLKTLLLEYRSGLESGIVRNGHRLAMSAASRAFSPAQALNELWSGIHQLKKIKALADELEEEQLKALGENLDKIAEKLFQAKNLKIALIGENEAISLALAEVQKLLDGIPKGRAQGFIPPDIELESFLPREGWTTSTAVSFVGKTFKTVRMLHEDAPALAVIAKLLRSRYLHREIREKGGAYGGFSLYNGESGVFNFGSYRDPHIAATLSVYDRASEFILSGGYSDEDIKESILQICSDIDKPDPPGPAARKSFYRNLIGLSDEARNQYKRRLLKVDRDQVVAVAKRYFKGLGKGEAGVSVISSEEKLKKANEKMADAPLTIHQI